jgi:hypothetical protein
LTVTATRRDPSAFEYVPSSSAPAVLGRSRTQPPPSTAVSSLMTQASQTAVAEDNNGNNGFVDTDDLIDPELRQLTTTQLGIERLEDASDTYPPGTLPPRLYQSNPFPQQTEPTEMGEIQ